MTDKPIALEVAAFLDSEPARKLRVSAKDVQRIATMFVEACYDGLGKAPWLLDGEDVRVLMTQQLPARLGKADPLGRSVLPVLEAMVEHLVGAHVVSHEFEIRRELHATSDEFASTVASGRYAGLAASKPETFVHGATKLGRNDPCSCGSGKKFKKCHGKDV